jgi:hypothetical protein
MLDDMAKGDDSGIAFDASSTLKTDESDATRSDSYPVSPVGPSEQAESTRASSISESTDETIQESNNLKQTTIDENASQDQEPLPEISQEPKEVTMSEKEEVVLAASEPTALEERQILLEAHESVPSQLEVTEMTPTAIQETHMLPKPVKLEPVVQQMEVAPSNASKLEPFVSAIQPKPAELKVEPEPEIIVQPITPKIQVREWKVPRSKFSTQDLKAAANPPEIPQEPVPTAAHQIAIAPKSPVGSTFSADTKRSLTEEDDERGQALKRKKRRGLVEPIRTDLNVTDRSAANSEANFSSDDDLMDELQSAVFQEAKPISVSKSPISPVFPSPKKVNGEPGRSSRVFSTPFRKEGSGSTLLDTPTPTQSKPTRSVSAAAAYLDQINQQAAKPLAKKANLGSGISQRIKALEKLGAGANTTPSTTGPTSGASTAFFSVRKGSVRGASRSPSIAERANSLTRDTSPSVSRESSPETFKIRERSGSIQSRVDAFKSNPIPNTQVPNRSRPESISVTARIIRDPAQPFPAKSEAGKNPADYAPLDLKQSPLVIDHQKAVAEPSKETIQERHLSKERRLSNASRTTTTTTKERRSSITIVREFISDTRASISERRRSMNLDRDISSPSMKSLSVKSPSRPPSAHQSPGNHRPMSISSRFSISSKDLSNGHPPSTAGSSSSISDEKGEKKSNRASRMLSRMSSSLSAGRKNITHAVSPTVREDPEPSNQSRSPTSPASQTPTLTSVNIGDVNVQFPDTLLWKRRSMLLDSQGYLIMSPALTASGNPKDKGNTGATRRFHLSEFRTPAVPDVEMQELPNSVVLDFVEGGGLQIACEDRAGQGYVLKGMSLAWYICPFLY